MGLAEVKRKQRLVGSARTRNTAWSNDASLPGQRLLSSMGWNAGQGLGTNNTGDVAPISVPLKLDNTGIGVQRAQREAKANGSDAWFGANGELDALYAQLNASASPAAASTPPSGSTIESMQKEKKHSTKKSEKQSTDAETVKQQQQQQQRKAKRRREKEDDKGESSSIDNAVDVKEKGKGKRKDKVEEEFTQQALSAQHSQDVKKRKEKDAKKKDKKEKKRKSKDLNDNIKGGERHKRQKSSCEDREGEKETDVAPPTNTVSPYGVFQYLSNRLILRRAEVRRKFYTSIPSF